MFQFYNQSMENFILSNERKKKIAKDFEEEY